MTSGGIEIKVGQIWKYIPSGAIWLVTQISAKSALGSLIGKHEKIYSITLGSMIDRQRWELLRKSDNNIYETLQQMLTHKTEGKEPQ